MKKNNGNRERDNMMNSKQFFFFLKSLAHVIVLRQGKSFVQCIYIKCGSFIERRLVVH